MNLNKVAPVPAKSEPVQVRQKAAEQPTNMATEQEDQRNVDQLKLALNLNCSEKNRLITSLNELSAILQCNKQIPEDAKPRIRKRIDDSMQLLVELSPFGPPIRLPDASGMFEELIFDQATVELTREERSKVISQLIANKDAVQFDGLINGKTKRRLISENRRIIDRLLDLPGKGQSCKADGTKSEEDTNGEPLSKKQRVELQVATPNEELDKLKEATKSQVEQITGLEAKLVELKREIRDITATRAEASFRFQLADVAKFFDVDPSVRHSDRFWCRGLQWSVYVERNLKEDGTKHLGLYLNCHNDDRARWSCKADLKLILFSNVRKSLDCFYEFTYTFKKKIAHGFRHFISYRELTDEKSGFIKDDRIVLGVELKAEPVVRE